MKARVAATLVSSIVVFFPLAGAGADSTPVEAGRVRVAAISFVPAKLGLEQNADRLEALVRQAAAGQAAPQRGMLARAFDALVQFCQGLWARVRGNPPG